MQQSLITQKLVIGNCIGFSQNFRQQIWQRIYEHILERSHSDVRCARDGSLKVHLSQLTWEPTVESDPTGKLNHLPIALLLWVYLHIFTAGKRSLGHQVICLHLSVILSTGGCLVPGDTWSRGCARSRACLVLGGCLILGVHGPRGVTWSPENKGGGSLVQGAVSW